MINFKNIEYLKIGNGRQKKAYKVLKELNVFESLKEYNPILTGTIPIEIDLPESDLDIICNCEDHLKFSKLLSKLFANKEDFKIKSKNWNGIKTTVAKFKTENFIIEIFAQNTPTENQNAYRHMVIEYKILIQRGSEFKADVKKLKSNGLKTEPAFAKILGIKGNPYKALLKLECNKI